MNELMKIEAKPTNVTGLTRLDEAIAEPAETKVGEQLVMPVEQAREEKLFHDMVGLLDDDQFKELVLEDNVTSNKGEVIKTERLQLQAAKNTPWFGNESDFSASLNHFEVVRETDAADISTELISFEGNGAYRLQPDTRTLLVTREYRTADHATASDCEWAIPNEAEQRTISSVLDGLTSGEKYHGKTSIVVPDAIDREKIVADELSSKNSILRKTGGKLLEVVSRGKYGTSARIRSNINGHGNETYAIPRLVIKDDESTDKSAA